MAYKTADGRIVVQKGDTLWGIAQKFLGNGNRWKELAGYSGDPRRMPIGTTLSLPGWKAPQAAAPAQATQAPPGKTDKEIIAEQYAKEEGIYNEVIGDVNQYRKGWTNIFTGGDSGYSSPDLSPEEQDAYKNALTDENAQKYQAYLGALAQIQALRADPYYQKRLAEGTVPDLNTPEGMEVALSTIMNKYTVKKTDAEGKEYMDSGITGLGIKSMNEIRNMAYMALQDSTATQEQQAKARELQQTWSQFGQSAAGARDQLSTQTAQSGLKGGVSNRQMSELSSTTAGMVNNINAEANDWRTAYMKNANMNNQMYAAKTRNEDILGYTKSRVLGSGITNADLKNKITQYTGYQYT